MHFAWQFSVNLRCADNGRMWKGNSFVESFVPAHTRGKYVTDIQPQIFRTESLAGKTLHPRQDKPSLTTDN
jgi:hypothetical protein